MNERLFSLGERLGACAEFVRQGSIVADIGTDHAYLPIWLVSTNKVPMAYASDINEEPIKAADGHIRKYAMSDKIITLTGAGLEKIPPNNVDDIVIAGMGGDNIINILNDAKWVKNSRYRLVLQPMSKADRLREYLYTNNFSIINEKALCEANRVYTVILAEYCPYPINYDEVDIYSGKLDNKDEYSVRLLKKQISVLLAEANGHEKCGDTEYAQKLKRIADRLENYIKLGEGE